MDLTEYAKGLGIVLGKETDTSIHSEKRYVVVVEVVVNKKKYTSANKLPFHDANVAKKLAMQKFRNVKCDAVSFRCMEITYAPVPIENVLTSRTEVQPIASRWLEPNELKTLLTN